MKQAFEAWKPTPGSVARLRQINKVLWQYEKMNITLTLRQLYYQLVSQNFIRNSQREYKNLGNLLSRARLAGLVDWAAIEDRGRQSWRALQFNTIQERVDLAVENFRLPRWGQQPTYVELWCEKDALTSVLKPICDDLHVTLMVNRGYSSSSAMYYAARRINEERGERDARIIYLGDFDPSGEDMVRDIRDRMATFLQDDQENLRVTKLALTPEQVSRYKLPPNPLKRNGAGELTDSRGHGFEARHGNESYEVDALPPDVLQRMVREEIEDQMDMPAYELVKEEEERLKKKLVLAGKGIR